MGAIVTVVSSSQRHCYNPHSNRAVFCDEETNRDGDRWTDAVSAEIVKEAQKLNPRNDFKVK